MTAPDLFARSEPPRRGPRLGPRWRKETTRILKAAAWADTPSSRKYLKVIRKYGLMPLEWEAFGHAQEWRCPGCGVQFQEDASDIRIDHCHTTGKVRGLLCHPCNIALGWVRDDAPRLRRLANYLSLTKTEGANDK